MDSWAGTTTRRRREAAMGPSSSELPIRRAGPRARGAAPVGSGYQGRASALPAPTLNNQATAETQSVTM
eukprot:10123401-Heterocapsa_arctica.AAC.1